MSSLRTPTAFDSPPEVHQCNTSTDSAACTAEMPHIRPAAHKAPMIARNFIAYLLQTPEQKNKWPLMSPGCCGWFKQAKHWTIGHGRAHARGMCRRTGIRPLEAQEMSGLECNCVSPLLIFACPRRAADSRCLAVILDNRAACWHPPALRQSTGLAGRCRHAM